MPPRAADASGPGAVPHTRPGRARDPVRSLRRGSLPLSFLRQPKLSSVRWKQAGSLAGQMSGRLLPVPYFHVVFTLPHELSALALGNRELLYRLLFDSAKETLLEVAADPKHLGARIGVLMVLHTWGQKLEHHPHVHCVVPGGGLAIPAKSSGSTATVPGDRGTALGVLPAQLVLAGPCAGSGLPRQVPGGLEGRPPSRPTPIRREHLAPGEPGGVGDHR